MALLGGLIILFFVCCGLFPIIETTIGTIIIIVGAIIVLTGIVGLFDEIDFGAIAVTIMGIAIIIFGCIFL